MSTKAQKIRVQCLECGRKFTTTSMLPECPKCGGSDIELADPLDTYRPA